MATPVWSDNPDANDLLGFTEVVAPVVDAVLDPKLDPVTVGIETFAVSGIANIKRCYSSCACFSAAAVVDTGHFSAGLTGDCLPRP